MPKFVHNSSSIECLSAQIISRDIVPSSFLNIKDIGKCFTYKCKKNSEAEILKELNPKRSIYCIESNLNIGDILECENLFVAINKNKPYTPTLINYTHRHKAQMFVSKEYTFAKISKQIGNIPLLNPPKQLTEK